MTAAKPKNIVELRRVLTERFPGVRMSAGPRETLANRWSTGLAAFDNLLGGGFAKAALNEVVTPGLAAGSAVLVVALLKEAVQRGEWLALIDGTDTFDSAALENSLLERLLWVRCDSARHAIKAADLILHDGTPAVVILDLAFCATTQLRRIPASTWFRLQRLVESTAAALLVLTPRPMVSNAETRLRLESRFSLDALDLSHDLLVQQLAPTLVEPALGMDRRLVGA